MSLHHVIDSDDCVTCPFCLHERWDDLYDYGDGDHEFECAACERKFVVRVATTRTYTSLIGDADTADADSALRSPDPKQDTPQTRQG